MAWPLFLVFYFPLIVSAPPGEELLTPNDAETVFEELLPAQNKSNELGCQLKLNPTEVKRIHSTYHKSQKRLQCIIVEFTRQTKTRPTWKVIIDALKSSSVSSPELAELLERKYCFPLLGNANGYIFHFHCTSNSTFCYSSCSK